MIRCALAEIFRPLRVDLRRRSSSSSSVSTFGSITTPLPITHSLPGCRIPDGIRCSFQVWPSRTIVWPALLPPWKRTTASARSASRSVIFPLPSSPHWAPTITIPGIRVQCRQGVADVPGAAPFRRTDSSSREPPRAAIFVLEVGRLVGSPLSRWGSLLGLIGGLGRRRSRHLARRCCPASNSAPRRPGSAVCPARAVVGPSRSPRRNDCSPGASGSSSRPMERWTTPRAGSSSAARCHERRRLAEERGQGRAG